TQPARAVIVERPSELWIHQCLHGDQCFLSQLRVKKEQRAETRYRALLPHVFPGSMSRNESKCGARPLLVRHGWKEHSVPGTSLVPVVFPVLPRTSSSRVYAGRSS